MCVRNSAKNNKKENKQLFTYLWEGGQFLFSCTYLPTYLPWYVRERVDHHILLVENWPVQIGSNLIRIFFPRFVDSTMVIILSRGLVRQTMNVGGKLEPAQILINGAQDAHWNRKYCWEEKFKQIKTICKMANFLHNFCSLLLCLLSWSLDLFRLFDQCDQ